MKVESGKRHDDSGSAEDDVLGNHYRAIADEITPRNLDEAVLGRARNTAARSASLFGPPGWYRPAAFAATLVLGIFILLQLSEIGVLQPIATNEPDTSGETGNAPAATRSFPEAAEREAARFRSLSESSNNSDNTRTASPGPTMRIPAERSPASEQNVRDGCNETEKSEAGSWYRCIQALADAGFSQAAEREMTELLQTYPRFALPELP